MAALSTLCTQMDKISTTSQNRNEYHMEVNRAMEIWHKAVGENAKNNETLQKVHKLYFSKCGLSIWRLSLVDIWNLKKSYNLRAVLVTWDHRQPNEKQSRHHISLVVLIPWATVKSDIDTWRMKRDIGSHTFAVPQYRKGRWSLQATERSLMREGKHIPEGMLLEWNQNTFMTVGLLDIHTYETRTGDHGLGASSTS